MRRDHVPRRLCAVTLTVVVGLAMSGSGVAAHDEGVTVVATGLDNPHGLALVPGGVVLVAEAGRGGASPCVQAPGQTDPNVTLCVGNSGAVTAVIPPLALPFGRRGERTSTRWRQYRVVRNLPSLAGPDGANAIGPYDVAITAGQLFATIGLGGNPQLRSALGPRGRLLGQVVRLGLFGHATAHADLVGYEAAHNPDFTDAGSVVDANPFGLLGDIGGRTIVADAAANAVLGIDRHGNVATLAVLHVSQTPAPPFLGLPPGAMIPMQSVPTSVARGPDHNLYIGQLTGFPFPTGGAQVFRLGPGGSVTPYASGFTNIIDIAFDRRGRLLVLSYADDGLLNTPPGQLTPGSLIRVEHDGTRVELAPGALLAPGAVAVALDGSIYVTNKSTVPGGGQVLRIRG